MDHVRSNPVAVAIVTVLLGILGRFLVRLYHQRRRFKDLVRASLISQPVM